jgi:DNA-binding CsgD family transcriptional regulator/tetratricopeptide (TPR) repeat protein
VSTVPIRPADVGLVGRDREIGFVGNLIRSIGRGARFVVIRGEAGIGKTALWRVAIQGHRAAGHRVLVTHAVEEELNGPIVGLVDLFAGESSLPAMPSSPEPDRYERGRAVLSTLRRLAAESPVLVAIDDVQWLDPVSAGALRYAFRRLELEPILVLATERSDASTPPDERTIPPDRREELFVGQLTFDGTRELVAPIVDTLPRPTLERLHELSGGNPLYAIELARSVRLFDDPLVAPAPPSLVAVLAGRVTALSDDVRHVLRVAAALGPSTAQAIVRASGLPDGLDSVTASVSDGLLVVGDDLVVRFAHPLLASAVLAGMAPGERQSLHAALAGVVHDPDARARHLALSCDDPDPGVATELHDAATRAARRGALALAADFAGHSLRLTPPADVEIRIRRAFDVVLHRAASGDKSRALADADRLVAVLPPGPARAEAIAMRVAIDFDGGDQYLEQAAAEAGDDESLLGRIIELRGWLDVVHRAELDKGEELAHRALEIAVRLGDPVLEMLAASTAASAGLLLARPRPELMARALDLAATTSGPRLGRGPLSVHGRHCLWCGQLREARTILESLGEAIIRAGLEFQRPYRILDLAALEIASGNLRLAADLVDEALEAAADAGNPQAGAWLSYPLGLVSVHRGDVDHVTAAAVVLRSRVNEQDGRTRLLMADHVLGLAALANGEPGEAVAALAPALQLAREIGVRLPSVVPVLPDAIEAAALTGDAEGCGTLADELIAMAADIKQPWVDAAAVRAEGLVALAEGSAGAADLLGAAAKSFDELGYRVDAARSLLLQGGALRRAGRRNPSADVLSDALRRFTEMDAAPWAALAEAELERVAPGRDQAELTPTESRIARLVAAGRRNREIAAELFVSVATVEAHLTRMYRKLHVRSRTELARVVKEPDSTRGTSTSGRE